jgi:hypothetical protein
LKLYQNALKLHSQGSAFFSETQEAYDELFNSEIFSYPESLSESRRREVYGDIFGDDDEDNDALIPASGIQPGGVDTGPSTLPQVLYLSFKNYGQFLLDRLTEQLVSKRKSGANVSETNPAVEKLVSQGVEKSVELFTQALEQDDTDSELWRRLSRLGEILGSQRIARYCMEAVLVAEGQQEATLADSLGLEGAFAKESLRDLVILIQDRLSEYQNFSSLQSWKTIPRTMRLGMENYPQLPVLHRRTELNEPAAPRTCTIALTESTWTSLGKAILSHMCLEPNAMSEMEFGVNYKITLPYRNERTTSFVLSKPTLEQDTVAADTAEERNGSSTVDLVKKTVILEDDTSTVDRLETISRPVTPKNDAPTKGQDISTSASDEGVVAIQDTKLPNPSSAVVEDDSEHDLSRLPDFVNLPTRKRTADSAGMQEPAEVRSRSKRIRAREAAPEDEADPSDLTQYYEDRLHEYTLADQQLFQTMNDMLRKLNTQELGQISDLKDIASPSSKDGAKNRTSHVSSINTVLRDFKDVLLSWDMNTSNLLLHGSGNGASVTLIDGADKSELATFLEHSRTGPKNISLRPTLNEDVTGLSEFATRVNQSWFDIDQLVMLWVIELLGSKTDMIDFTNRLEPSKGFKSRYTEYAWPSSLKEVVGQVLVTQDKLIFNELENQFQRLCTKILTATSQGKHYQTQINDEVLVDLVQTIYEIHLDIYGRIISPSSKVDQPTRTVQQDCLKRWAALSSQVIDKCSAHGLDSITKPLSLRYLWSLVTFVGLVDLDARDHVLLCLQDLKIVLEEAGSPRIELLNNAIMSEISADAADREISKLTTMEFFLNVFNPKGDDPLAVIESLEPLLMASTNVSQRNEAMEKRTVKDSQDSEITTIGDDSTAHPKTSDSPNAQQMVDFLDKANPSLRLSLWNRLRTAYTSIEYPPMAFLCNIRSMDIILKELRSPAYRQEQREDRTANLVVWIRNLSDLVTKSLKLAMDSPAALGCMDEDHLRIALECCVEVTKTFHIFALWDDSTRVGQLPAIAPASGAANAYKTSMNYLRDMQVKAWLFQYIVLREATSQNLVLFESTEESLVGCLRSIHNALGLRQYCKISKKLFPRFMKSELLRLGKPGDIEQDMAQIVYDLYGLKICHNSQDLIDHGCEPDSIDRGSALNIMDSVMLEVRRLTIKELPKTDLKVTIDRMQAAMGGSKLSSKHLVAHQTFNKRVIAAFLKSPINPIDLYRSLKGVGSLSAMPVSNEYADIARKGWYFLLGYMAFVKFRSVKRVNPGPTEDLDTAITYLRIDLEFDSEKWETWYRLGQVYDTKIEEDTTWNADKINDPKSELVNMQRNAIHCYSMAIAVAIRQADESFETAGKISELYTDFGNRIYASSREPFSMAAFDLREYEKFYNSETRGTYKKGPFRPLNLLPAWKFASVLFRQALVDKPDSWM